MKYQIYFLLLLVAKSYSLKCFLNCEGQLCETISDIISLNLNSNLKNQTCDETEDRCAVNNYFCILIQVQNGKKQFF